MSILYRDYVKEARACLGDTFSNLTLHFVQNIKANDKGELCLGLGET